MTTFLDGPAAGVVLGLKRAPVLLRVVRAVGGDWDALDQLTDSAAPDEAITVYARASEPFSAHVNMGRKGCFWFESAEYRVLAVQPADAAVRTNAAWRAWATAYMHENMRADPPVETR